MKSKIKIIAEVGINHDGSLKKAKKLVKVCKDIGADYVKFQSFKTSSLVSKNSKKSKYQIKKNSKDNSLFNMLNKIELTFNDTKNLFNYAKKINMKIISTPFDILSADELEKLNMKIYKISSGDIDNIPLIQNIAKKNKPIIISTGRSNISDIDQAIKYINRNGNNKISILHCVSSYPTKYEDLNLNVINQLKKKYKYEIGFSDHSLGIEAPIAAVSLGATIIEKHITLDKNSVGPDHFFSLNPNEFKSMISQIKNVETALGNPDKRIYKSEHEGLRKARRSLYTATEIKKNDYFTEHNISVLRPAHGLKPIDIYKFIGKKSKRNIKKGALLKLSMIDK